MHPKKVLAELGIKPLKRLSQNFLFDPGIASRIVGLSQPDPEAKAIEIGPGLGIMTGILSQRFKEVIAFEIDNTLSKYLHNNSPDNVVIHHVDILEVDLSNYIDDDHKWHIISNMPYGITGPILEKIETVLDKITCAVLTMQEEVARRISAQPGTRDRGKLSLLLQRVADIKLAHKILPGAFYPSPNVSSRVVIITPKPDIQPLPEFKTVVKHAFEKRRKNLKNALANLFRDSGSILTSAGIDPNRRAESLSIYEFEIIARKYKSLSES